MVLFLTSFKRVVWLGMEVGFFIGFACGYLYGIGGFFYDLMLTGINQGTWLALNALWGMPLLFSVLGGGSFDGLFLLYTLLKKLSTASR